VAGKHILEEYEDANREAADAQQTVRGVLRVAAPTTFGAMHLGSVVANYLAAHPDVTVETTLNDRYVDLLAEGIDVAIRIGQLKDSDLIARRLAPCRMVFCAAPSFLAQHGVPKTVEQLRQTPRLAFSEAVSAGDWALTDGDGNTHLVDGTGARQGASAVKMIAGSVASKTTVPSRSMSPSANHH
jgi:DNA-binding transcriptional LysR family regulator